MSDGLIPPLNAPPGAGAGLGVQPGVTSGVVVATQVIVYGPAGQPTGLFLYAAGTTPGPGNPPLVAITSSASDPYGNTVSPTGTLTAVTIGQDGQPQLQLAESGGQGLMLVIVPGFTSGVLFGGQSGSFAFLELQGPASAIAGFTDTVTLDINSSDGVSSSANAEHVYKDPAGNSHAYAIEDCGGFRILAGTIAGVDPATGGSSANPANTETVHSFAPLAAGYNILGAGDYANYWMSPLGETRLSAHIAVTAGPGIAFVQLTTVPLPPAYRPKVTDRTGVLTANEMAIFSGSNNAGGLIKLATSGHIFVYGASTFATEIDFDVAFRLDY